VIGHGIDKTNSEGGEWRKELFQFLIHNLALLLGRGELSNSKGAGTFI
jgi:hypothetical protein